MLQPQPIPGASPAPSAQPSTDEERLRRLSSALCTMWAMVTRGIWPHSMLKRYLPPQILTALPPIPPGGPASHEPSRTTGVLVDIHGPLRASASAVLQHPDGTAEAVALDYRRSDPRQRWHIDQFVPIRYRHLQLALAHADPPPHPDELPLRLRDDLRTLIGDPPADAKLRVDWYQVAEHLTVYARARNVAGLVEHLTGARALVDPERALAARAATQYRALAAHERGATRMRPFARDGAGPTLQL